MNLFYVSLFILISTFSITMTSAEEGVVENGDLIVQVLEIIPLKNDRSIIIIDDPAKTVFLSVDSLSAGWETGQTLVINDPYRIQEETIIIHNVSNNEICPTRRLGATTGNLYEIKDIYVSPYGLNPIKITLRMPMSREYEGYEFQTLYLKDNDAFLSNFHLDDVVYIISTPDSLWPTFKELYRVYYDSMGSYSNTKSCLLNLNGICSEFYSSDISSFSPT